MFSKREKLTRLLSDFSLLCNLSMDVLNCLNPALLCFLRPSGLDQKYASTKDWTCRALEDTLKSIEKTCKLRSLEQRLLARVYDVRMLHVHCVVGKDAERTLIFVTDTYVQSPPPVHHRSTREASSQPECCGRRQLAKVSSGGLTQPRPTMFCPMWQLMPIRFS